MATDNQMYDLTLEQPVSVWNREVKLDLRKSLKSIAQVAQGVVALDAAKGALGGAGLAASVGFKDEPGQVAWVLVCRALNTSLVELVFEYRDLFDREAAGQAQVAEQLSGQLLDILNNIEISFDAALFSNPQSFILLSELAPGLSHWLKGLGLSDLQASAFCGRLGTKFALELHNEWTANPNDYQCIQDRLQGSPFLEAATEQRSWMNYNAWLVEQANARMFEEAFSLRRIYVPLRAWYQTRPDDGVAASEAVNGFSDQHVKHVVNLHDEVKRWVLDFDAANCVRVVSGGPGSGKSSFCKIFAAELIEAHPEVQLLFVPLHHFDLTGDLLESVERFVRGDRFLKQSPLDPAANSKRLLLVFDGLDELAQQGPSGADVADRFLTEVTNTLSRLNDQGACYQALISGREMAVQSAKDHFRKQAQILHLLPYYVDKSVRASYSDPGELLVADQRTEWWNKYGFITGKDYETIPEELKKHSLTPITAEPLLNYLVALSFEGTDNNIDWAGDISLNVIYKDLLHRVYERGWEGRQHNAVVKLSEADFARTLEEVALAIWHENGRTASISLIAEHCRDNGLEQALQKLAHNAAGGVTRLLTAFYFRQSGSGFVGDQKFEFTHKSFGEYLVARRLVRAFTSIHNGIKRRDEGDFDDGLSLADAVDKWAKYVNRKPVDKYVLDFIQDEVRLTRATVAVELQTTASRMLAQSINNEDSIARAFLGTSGGVLGMVNNLYIATLAIRSACALVTEQTEKLNLAAGSNTGLWLSRVLSAGEEPIGSSARFMLQYLDMEKAWLTFQHFINCSFEGASFRQAQLAYSNFTVANLNNSDFSNASLYSANLMHAGLERGNLEGSQLQEARLEGATLRQASLVKSQLLRANICRADLREANVSRADADGADFRSSTLTGADFKAASLVGADFDSAMCARTNFADSDLSYANFRERGLALTRERKEQPNRFEGANFTGAKLVGVDFEGVNLTGAIFDADADLTGAIFDPS